MKQEIPAAFPCVGKYSVISEGMDLRDWFAGQALSSIFARSIQLNETPEDIAEACYVIADAMIAEKKKKS